MPDVLFGVEWSGRLLTPAFETEVAALAFIQDMRVRPLELVVLQRIDATSEADLVYIDQHLNVASAPFQPSALELDEETVVPYKRI